MRIRQNNVEKIVSHAGFYLLQCPAAYAMLATPGFPAVHEAQFSTLLLADYHAIRRCHDDAARLRSN